MEEGGEVIGGGKRGGMKWETRIREKTRDEEREEGRSNERDEGRSVEKDEGWWGRAEGRAAEEEV